MARRRVTMQIDTPGRLEDPPQLYQPDAHHRQVGHHVVAAEQPLEGVNGNDYLDRAGADYLVKGPLGLRPPVPGVLEGRDLRLRGLPRRLPEEDVVGRLGVEGRVEVDEVHRLVADVLPEDF